MTTDSTTRGIPPPDQHYGVAVSGRFMNVIVTDEAAATALLK